MAIYHFSAKVMGRSNGSSAVASAAYRSGSELHDDRLDKDHDFTGKDDVVHSEVMLPEGAPARLADREVLWNAVEAGEKRKDAQLAREIEFSIPREMNQRQGIELAQTFVARQFVARGMIADLNVHWDKARDGSPKPHAHVMLTMREVGPGGFGQKVRAWNSAELLKGWREAWAAHVNERMAELGLEARIDHRSLADQGVALEPQHKIGPAAARRPGQGLEAERIEDHSRIARENGDKIIADPSLGLAAITRQQATFTLRELAAFAFRHSDGKEQFDRVMAAVRTSPEMISLGKDERDQERFTSREMIEVESRLERSAGELARTERHGVGAEYGAAAIGAARTRGLVLSGEQQDAFERVTGAGDLSSVIGYAGSGKSAMLGVAREAWMAAGYRVRGAALSGIAAENLEAASGIASRTLASFEHQWGQGRELLGKGDVLVIDEAGMIGTRQMEQVLSTARAAGAKVVLVGDPEQLQAIEAGAAFRAISEWHGAVEITEIRRQREDWQRGATRALATGRTGEALAAYEDRDMVHAAETRDAARGALVEGWERQRQASPDKTRIILTHTNAEVRDLNEQVRGRLRAEGKLGEDVGVKTERGVRQFASGDRLMFLRNERDLGVKNGTLGTIEQARPDHLVVKLDGGQRVAFDTAAYAHVDHGYAATIHKAQGVTVDAAHVLATPGMDRHAAYVALSRHRDGVQLHYGRDDFADRDRLVRTLSRDRAKDMAGDYPAAQSIQDQARMFAERREIHWPERVVEAVREAVATVQAAVQTKAKGMFGGFKPKLEAPESAPSAKPKGRFADFRPKMPELEAPAAGEYAASFNAPDQREAIGALARAVADMERMTDKGLPVLPHQTQAFEKAGEVVDNIRPGSARQLAAVFKRDPEIRGEAAAGRFDNLRKGINQQRAIEQGQAMLPERDRDWGR